jgi:hypothetical protein
MIRTLALLAAATVGLAACTTMGGAGAGPTDVVRYHLGAPVERGTVIVQPAEGGDGLSGQPFAAAVARELGSVGYVPAAPGGAVQFVAIVGVRRSYQEGPRRSAFTIGIGGGTFGGGGNGGVGLGGGVGIPVGGKRTQYIGTELTVTIKRRLDQSPVWEGQARTVARGPAGDAAAADKLAAALFAGFPGESGRTITVR